jgi:hypothetical protein
MVLFEYAIGVILVVAELICDDLDISSVLVLSYPQVGLR